MQTTMRIVIMILCSAAAEVVHCFCNQSIRELLENDNFSCYKEVIVGISYVLYYRTCYCDVIPHTRHYVIELSVMFYCLQAVLRQ